MLRIVMISYFFSIVWGFFSAYFSIDYKVLKVFLWHDSFALAFSYLLKLSFIGFASKLLLSQGSATRLSSWSCVLTICFPWLGVSAPKWSSKPCTLFLMSFFTCEYHINCSPEHVLTFVSQHLKLPFDTICFITAMSALSSTGTGVPVWPSLWWTMIGCPLMISLARLWPHWVTSAGRVGRVLHLLERPFNPSSCTCPAKNQAVC